MTDQLDRVDLANGFSWYFLSSSTAKERAEQMLSHVYDTLKEIELNYDNVRNISDDRRHQLLQKLNYEIDFATGLLEETD